MTKTYSDFDLIRYLYQELCPEECASLRQFIQWDIDTRDRYNLLLESAQLLNLLESVPSQTSVHLIMDYSRKTKPLTATM